MPENASSLSLLVQGGAVGLCMVAMYVILTIVREHRKEMKDTLDRNTQAMMEITKSSSALAASLPSLCQFRKHQ